ncbi:PF09917 family protein [Leptospira inadai serovar Lyme str. 10]|uniref:PF09917 family protein n=2 Tax=Leptospira inadai serovar Lyme TaxID=293084 RepID=V6I0T2_9LEPT|nr:DUF2147 domain-containing protein [Leptospira inadai]EQA38869.1 PF09917 family protein [Leptospira inadai serovar Lyme str. 10]PNV72275.1 DUF2147 domain-containing protein [Leptospira inadai serovar Lyme]
MKRVFNTSYLILLFLISGSLFAQPLPVTGSWKTINEQGKEESVVEIYEQGGKIFGKVTSLAEPNDKDGKPARCTECDGPEKNKPVLGMVIINGLSPDGDKWSGGRILDPNDGVWYKCFLRSVEGGKKLEVRGYVGFSLLGRTQYWVKK